MRQVRLPGGHALGSLACCSPKLLDAAMTGAYTPPLSWEPESTNTPIDDGKDVSVLPRRARSFPEWNRRRTEEEAAAGRLRHTGVFMVPTSSSSPRRGLTMNFELPSILGERRTRVIFSYIASHSPW
jgi:hypothetical protein